MRTFAVIALVLAGSLASLPALACGVDSDFRQEVRVDPVSSLFQEASRLDVQAASQESIAAPLERNAEELAARARLLRAQANTRVEINRAALLARAEELSAQGAVARAQAAERRVQSSHLRAEARRLRDEANRLAGNGRRRTWHSASL